MSDLVLRVRRLEACKSFFIYSMRIHKVWAAGSRSVDLGHSSLGLGRFW